MVKALQAGVSPEGQKLFLAIAKTIPSIRLAGQNIVVWDNVTIVPPYKLDNIHGNVESKPFQQVRKVVGKKSQHFHIGLKLAFTFCLLFK